MSVSCSLLLPPLLNSIFAANAQGRWTIGIGDPTVIGWTTVVLYFLASFFCFNTMFKSKKAPAPPPRRIQFCWLALGCTLFLLGVNKQLDLQSLFTQVAKDMARSGGWYEYRRNLQAAFIVSICIVGFFAVSLLAWLLRGHFKDHALALAGAVYLICFVIVRAASFHHFDVVAFTWKGPWDININNVMEIGGIVCVLFAAMRRRYQE